MEALIWLTLAALVFSAPFWYPRWTLQRALARPLPPSALAILERNIPVYRRMAPALQQQLQRLVIQFLHQKKIVGCLDLEVTEEMRVTIAAQACLLLLNRPSKVYPALHTILLYPGAFVAGRQEVGPGGVITDTRQQMLGESWQDGRVVLSWDDVQRGAEDWSDGHNVVLHEFAHKLDGLNGAANGMPPLGQGMSKKRWTAAMSEAYTELNYRVASGEPAIINPYAATSPAEFFAVLTEYFFTAPEVLKATCPSAYSQLTLFYRPETYSGRA